jgi:hypothetical protein
VIGDPVPGEDQRVAPDEPDRACAEIDEFDPIEPAAADHAAQCRRRPYRGPPACRSGKRERSVALLPGLVGDQRDDIGARVRERDHRREADVLGADDQGAAVQSLSVEVNALLQLPGGHNAMGPVAGDQPRWARTLPAAGGEQHRRRGDGLDAIGAGQDGGPGSRPAGDRGPGSKLGACPDCGLGIVAGVARSGHDPVQVA